MKLRALLLLSSLLVVTRLQAEVVYSNTTTDTLDTIFPSVNEYLEIGDQISLAGTARSAQSATVQYFSLGSGTFDATLRFYNVGSPVGPQIGSLFFVTNIATGDNEIGTITFPLGGLTLPDEVIFMFAESNLSDGLSVGLNLFEPPTIGSSSNEFIVVRDTDGFRTAVVGAMIPPADNLYFSLDASSVPETASLRIVVSGLVTVGAWYVCRKGRPLVV